MIPNPVLWLFIRPNINGAITKKQARADIPIKNGIILSTYPGYSRLQFLTKNSPGLSYAQNRERIGKGWDFKDRKTKANG